MKKMWRIHLLLAIFIAVAANGAYRIWTEEKRAVPAPAREHAVRQVPAKKRAAEPPPLKEAAFSIITDQNLFSPDRAEFIPPEPEKKPDAEKPRLPGRPIHLYGVIIMENLRKALITNPVKKPDEPPNLWVNAGETVGEFTVVSIDTESILLKEEKGTEYRILLNDEDAKSPLPRLQGEETRPATPPESADKKPPLSPASPVVLNADSEKKKEAEAAVPNKDAKSGEYKIVNTPFGQIKKRAN